jgi:hypothetical protein
LSGDRGSPKLKLQHTNFRRTPDAGVWPAPPGYQGGMRRVTERSYPEPLRCGRAPPAVNAVSLPLRIQVQLLDGFFFTAKRQSGAAHRRDRQTALLAVRFDAQVTTHT